MTHPLETQLDPYRLLLPEARHALQQRGIHVAVKLTDAEGAQLSADSLIEAQAMIADLTARMSRVQQLAAIGEVSASVAHEARNLLTGVLGLSTLRSGGTEHLDLLRNEAARCTQLLSTFLRFTSPPKSPTRMLSASEVIDPVLLLLSAESQTRNCTLRSAIVPHMPNFAGHPDKLRQILLNLTLNALQASSEDGWVEVRAFHDDVSVHFEVEDNGPGIPEGKFEAIFAPFFSTKAEDVGTGLGLSTSRELVDAMGGTLRAYNRAGGGACFELTLPLAETVTSSWFPPATGAP